MAHRYQALCSVCFARGWRVKLACDRDHVKIPSDVTPVQGALENLSVYDTAGELIARERLVRNDRLDHAADRILAGLRKAGLIESRLALLRRPVPFSHVTHHPKLLLLHRQ